ncbi:4-hydroxybenzoate octaprenyltransferase [Rhodoligotrophos ferricapiens]|uniref:4-hydroxybenzoate octaprenyltransferase n=1 Tax=Rhodoligotrophos ferricapiens TaxID=3069264 RepID=UPI00315D153B
MSIDHSSTGTVADAVQRNWVDRYAPRWMRPYCRLARFDRPIGTWLLLLPCWWSIALAQIAAGGGLPSLWLLFLFAVGAIVMRGAGCTYNDIVDRDIDDKVARTRSRPIPSGQVTARQAAAFMVLLSLVGLAVLLQLNRFAILLGCSSLLLVAAYPFMKRITYWPQMVLGLAFNWGALLGWAAVHGSLSWPPLVLYIAGIAWTLGYDTIYAHQDKDDDALIGVKSTALKFGSATRAWLILFYAIALIGIALAGFGAGAGLVFLTAWLIACAHAAWQIRTLDIDDPARCLILFRSNRDFGIIVFLGLLADSLLAPI